MALSDNIYKVQWSRVAKWFIPALLRRPKRLAFVYALIAPFTDLHNRFYAHKEYLKYWIGIDSQVCKMEKALNDRYDISQRRIQIVDAPEMLALPFYQPEENKPITLYKNAAEGAPIVLYTRNETGVFTVDFIVRVPVFVQFDIAEFRAFVETFKTPSKTFSIAIV